MCTFSHERTLLYEGQMLSSLLVEPHFYLATGHLLAGTEEFWHPSIVHYSSFQVYQIWSLAPFPFGFLPGKLEVCTQEDDDCIPRVNIRNFWGWEMLLSVPYVWVMRSITSRKQQLKEQLSLFETWVSDVLSFFHLIVFECILGQTGK